jgi:hypothetical protein
MAKKWSAEKGVYITRESMELMGGIGYIEDGVMPKLMRDMMVLPIWEGSGNIIILDMLRALGKSEGFKAVASEISKSSAKSEAYGDFLKEKLKDIIRFGEELRQLPQDEMEATAKVFFDKLTSLYQISLLVDALNEGSRAWIEPALKYLTEQYTGVGLQVVKPLSVDEVNGLLGWEL